MKKIPARLSVCLTVCPPLHLPATELLLLLVLLLLLLLLIMMIMMLSLLSMMMIKTTTTTTNLTTEILFGIWTRIRYLNMKPKYLTLLGFMSNITHNYTRNFRQFGVHVYNELVHSCTLYPFYFLMCTSIYGWCHLGCSGLDS